jgi:hypothetical protein
MLAMQRAWPDAVIYRRNVGAANLRGRFVRFGIKGQADISATIEGRTVEVECKVGTGRQRIHQRNWQLAIERAGGCYVLARDADSAVADVRAWLHRNARLAR